MNLNNQIISELRKQLESRVISEDIVNEAIIYIDPVPGKPRPDIESYILVSGLDMASRKILRDVSGSDEGGDDGFEYLDKVEEFEPGHMREPADQPQDEDEGVQTPIPQHLPDYSKLVTTYQTMKAGAEIAALNKQMKFLASPNGAAAIKADYKLMTALQELGTLDMDLEHATAIRNEKYADFQRMKNRPQTTSIKTPWMLFIDWLWKAMKQNGLKPFRNRGFDADPIYGALGIETHERPASPYATSVDRVNTQSAVHDLSDEELAELQRQGVKDPNSIGAGDILRLHARDLRVKDTRPSRRNAVDKGEFVELNPSEFWKGSLDKDAPEDEEPENLGEAKRHPSQAKDDIYTIEYVTKGLGKTHFEVAKNFLAILQKSGPPAWVKLSLDGNEHSASYGRIYVGTKMQVSGYESGPSRARGPEPAYPYPKPEDLDVDTIPDYAGRGKTSLPDQEYDEKTGRMVNVGPGKTIDTDELLKQAGGDYEKMGRMKAELVRQWSRPPAELDRYKSIIQRLKAELHEITRAGGNEVQVDKIRANLNKAIAKYEELSDEWQATKSGGAARHLRAKAHSRASHETMAVDRNAQKADIFKKLLNGGKYTKRVEGKKQEKEPQGILKIASEFGLEPPEVKMAVTRYLENAGFNITDLDNLSDFMELSDEDKNAILRLLERAESNFLLELGNLTEAVRVWANAIAEGNHTKIARASRNVELMVEALPPLPVNEREELIDSLFQFRRRNALVREFLRDNPNVYAAMLALRGISHNNILNILAEQGIITEFSSNQLHLIRQLGTTLVEGSIGKCVAKANTILQTVCKIDRPVMTFNNVIANIGKGELRYLSSIVPQQVINSKGYLQDIPTEEALKAVGSSTSNILSNSKNRDLVSEAFWRKHHRHLQLRSE